MRQEILERGDRALGAVFLPEREHAVHHDHADDGQTQRRHALAGFVVLGEECESGGEPENQGEEMREFAREPQRERLAPDLLDPVGAEFDEPPRGLGGGETALAAAQAGEGLGDRELGDPHAMDCSAVAQVARNRIRLQSTGPAFDRY